jgi:hypothetical protein
MHSVYNVRSIVKIECFLSTQSIECIPSFQKQVIVTQFSFLFVFLFDNRFYDLTMSSKSKDKIYTGLMVYWISLRNGIFKLLNPSLELNIPT